jgi:signal transduction histidine kinase
MGLLEAGALAAPLALAIACAAVIERRREHRRRAILNRALHELRRPLHFLALMRSASSRSPDRDDEGIWGQIDAALAALGDLDAEINGGRSPTDRRWLRAEALVSEAIERWRWPARLLGRRLELRWSAGGAAVLGDRAALSRAIDNLVANSLEHGATRVRFEGSATSGRLRIAVVDDPAEADLAGPLAKRPARGDDPRRGHGLAVSADIASAHGGRLMLSGDGAGTRAVLELPLLRPPASIVSGERRGAAA